MGARYYSPLDIDDHALFYAQFIVKRGQKVLTFYPKKKSANATANKFRRKVLELLLGKKMPYGERVGTWLPRLEDFAEKAGFTINEVNAGDYQ